MTATESTLTQESFWESFWGNIPLPNRINPDFSFERCLARAFEEKVPRGDGKLLLEVGCAPGRWMVFFNQALGYVTDGIEYVPVATEKTRENLALNGVPGRVFQADFLNHGLPPRSYDAVVSLGFIEHFDPVEPVIAKHVELLKPGGTLVLGVPNFRGLNYYLERLLDKPLLEAHNTAIMRPSFFRGLTRRYPLELTWSGYIGGFEPALISFGGLATEPPRPAGAAARPARAKPPGKAVRLARRLAAGVLRRLHGPRNRSVRADFINGSWFSSYLLSIYRRTDVGAQES